jgi:hypothetical protein
MASNSEKTCLIYLGMLTLTFKYLGNTTGLALPAYRIIVYICMQKDPFLFARESRANYLPWNSIATRANPLSITDSFQSSAGYPANL